ncbi:virulence associated lipoprotein [Borrelia crocidurae]|uniref:virulence associated lipoprotein n=1 Tax=Borrelia crocidurae TaxID=29520 RepID=UPI001F5241BE|nr:virulence associated lipoprotein [Borrelia crocidurae]
MKQKIFIIFMLISLLLIACGQNGETAETQRQLEQAREERQRRENGLLEYQRNKEIEYIKNATSSDVKLVLENHNNANWNGEQTNAADFVDILFVFEKVPHKVDGGTESLYNNATATGDAAAAGKAAKKEVYLALHYDLSFIKDFGLVFKKFVNTSALVTQYKNELKDFFDNIRAFAKAYYIDAHDTLQKKLNKLNSLSLDEARVLSGKLEKLETKRLKLLSGVIAQVKSDLNNSSPGAGSVHLKGNATTPAQIKTYWEARSATFNDDCADIVRISGEIKGILEDIK